MHTLMCLITEVKTGDVQLLHEHVKQQHTSKQQQQPCAALLQVAHTLATGAATKQLQQQWPCVLAATSDM